MSGGMGVTPMSTLCTRMALGSLASPPLRPRPTLPAARALWSMHRARRARWRYVTPATGCALCAPQTAAACPAKPALCAPARQPSATEVARGLRARCSNYFFVSNNEGSSMSHCPRKSTHDIHRMKYTKRTKQRQKDPQTRAMLSFRFKTLYQNIGLDRAGVAKVLHVSERTVINWEQGIHDIPYSAYKALRLMAYVELPGQAWKGWHFHSGKLWTPEGHGFVPTDSNWWSLLCRRAELFTKLYTENTTLKSQLKQQQSNDLSLGHFRTSLGSQPLKGIFCPANHRYRFKTTGKPLAGGAL
jgi:DNA-binding transcriptional regulator YiaG